VNGSFWRPVLRRGMPVDDAAGHGEGRISCLLREMARLCALTLLNIEAAKLDTSFQSVDAALPPRAHAFFGVTKVPSPRVYYPHGSWV